MAKTKIIIDCDPGCDDAIALIAALTSPDIEVLGITSIGGNVDPAKTQRNALGICALVGRTDVPVFSGADRPLAKAAVLADDIHGESGVDGLVLPFDQMAKARNDMDAADFILTETRKHPGDPITLIVIGPMTNLAIAYQRDNTLPTRVREVITMGGAFGNPGGNITPYAEFNIFCDPKAAKIAYDAFPAMRTFPLDVTHKFMQGPDFRVWLSSKGPRGENIQNMLQAYAASYPGMNGQASPLHDFHTIAAILHPEIYTFVQGQVEVIEGGQQEGRTVLTKQASGPARVALEVDAARFQVILKEALSLYLDAA